MNYTIKVPDEFNTALGKVFGSESNPNEAIQAYLDTHIKAFLVDILEENPEVKAAKQVYEAKVAEKTAAINVAGK